MEKDFYAFEGCGYDGHGDSGEETGSGGLGDCEVGLGICLGGECSDELLTNIIALGTDSVNAWRWKVENAYPEADSDCKRKRQSWGNELELLELSFSHIGVTPTSGAETPA